MMDGFNHLVTSLFSSSRKMAGMVIILIIAVAVPVTLGLIKQNQDNRQDAAVTTTSSAPTCGAGQEPHGGTVSCGKAGQTATQNNDDCKKAGAGNWCYSGKCWQCKTASAPGKKDNGERCSAHSDCKSGQCTTATYCGTTAKYCVATPNYPNRNVSCPSESSNTGCTTWKTTTKECIIYDGINNNKKGVERTRTCGAVTETQCVESTTGSSGSGSSSDSCTSSTNRGYNCACASHSQCASGNCGYVGTSYSQLIGKKCLSGTSSTAPTTAPVGGTASNFSCSISARQATIITSGVTSVNNIRGQVNPSNNTGGKYNRIRWILTRGSTTVLDEHSIGNTNNPTERYFKSLSAGTYTLNARFYPLDGSAASVSCGSSTVTISSTGSFACTMNAGVELGDEVWMRVDKPTGDTTGYDRIVWRIGNSLVKHTNGNTDKYTIASFTGVPAGTHRAYANFYSSNGTKPSEYCGEKWVTVAAAPTNTPTNTPTRTPTNTPTRTPSPTGSGGAGGQSPQDPPTNTPTRTPTATNTPTRTPTRTPTTPVNPTATPTVNPQQMNLRLMVTLPGVGSGTGNNPNPVRPNRQGKVEIYNVQNVKVKESDVSFAYHNDVGAPNTNRVGVYMGNVELTNTPAGTYYVKVRFDNTLFHQLPGVYNLALGSNNLPAVELAPGDLNQDNNLNMQDYSIFVACYGEKECESSKKQMADFNDDGVVDGIDYNILIRSFAIRSGD